MLEVVACSGWAEIVMPLEPSPLLTSCWFSLYFPIVIYRCAYEDDEAWSWFKQIVEERFRAPTASPDMPEAGNTLEGILFNIVIHWMTF